MDWITDRIAIGNVDDAMNTEQLEREGVTAVLSLFEIPKFTSDCRLVQQRITFDDGPGNSIEVLDDVLSTLDILLTEHHKVLVHCMEGVSRSPFVVACHLALRNKINLSNALNLVAEKREIFVNSCFSALWDEYLIWRDA